jgi:outer membrane protein TolC
VSSQRTHHRARRAALGLSLPLALALALPVTAQQAAPQPAPNAGPRAAASDVVTPVARRIGFREAVAQAMQRNPTAAVAVEEIRRVAGLMEETRAASLPTLSVTATYTRLNKARTFQTTGTDGGTETVEVAGKDQGNVTGSLSIPILAPQSWANWSRAADQIDVARASQRDVQRTLAITAGRAYLTIFAQKRQVEVNRQARDNSRAHLEYADARLRGGIGNRIDWARSGEELESNEAILQTSFANLYRSQEALGILLGENEPMDVEEIPDIPEPPSLDQALAESPGRADLLLFELQRHAADRSLNMSWTEYLPSITLIGQPFYQNPSSLTTPETGWQAQAVLTWFLFDGGARYGRTHQREAALTQAQIQLDAAIRQAHSEVRQSIDNVERTATAVQRGRASARLANEAMRLAEVAYRAGSSTNLELIDAQRRARDAETIAVIAEDNQRQAALDLLAAAGRFPSQLQQPPPNR